MHKSHYNISAAYDLADAAIRAVREEGISSLLRDYLDFSDPEFWARASVPNRQTLLHRFLVSFEEERWSETMDIVEIEENVDDIGRYLDSARIPRPAWLCPAKCEMHRRELFELLDSAIPIVADAAFQLLLQDREFLYAFHLRLADALRNWRYEQGEGEMVRIPRCDYVPQWLKRGLYYRDHGTCQKCFKDVSGALNLDNIIHMDHIVPLDGGGTNDPSNFQILCAECNLRKGAADVPTLNQNRSFW